MSATRTHKLFFAGLPVLAALLLTPASRLIAQAATPPSNDSTGDTTGVSHPELLNDDINAAPPQEHYQKPSPAVPAPAPQQPPAPSTETYSDTYVPYQPTLQTHPDAGDHYVPRATASTGRFDPNDPNSGVVLSVPTAPNELPVGTRITAQLSNTISTRETSAGTLFTAVLSQPILHQGQVLVPAGSSIQGRITQIHGGRRISGASAVRLQPDTLVLPDHTFFRINAEVVDLDHFRGSHVNREGVITKNSNGKTTAAVLGGTTATTTIAGAMIGGGVGAVVGAGIGAGVGTVWWLRQDQQQTLPSGTEIVFGLNEPLIIAHTN